MHNLRGNLLRVKKCISKWQLMLVLLCTNLWQYQIEEVDLTPNGVVFWPWQRVAKEEHNTARSAPAIKCWWMFIAKCFSYKDWIVLQRNMPIQYQLICFWTKSQQSTCKWMMKMLMSTSWKGLSKFNCGQKAEVTSPQRWRRYQHWLGQSHHWRFR